MKFKVGDKIQIVHTYIRMGRNHVGMKGVVTELRRYPISKKLIPFHPTHYLVKFENYKIPHIYFIQDIDDSCELIEGEYE